MATFERMLDKRKKPTPALIERFLGEESIGRLAQLEAFLSSHYHLNRELRFPFGNNYGWGYKYSHGRKHLCYAFFEEGAFTVTLQIGDEAADRLAPQLGTLLPQTQELWASRYPCGERGGWLHYRVTSDEVLSDIFTLIQAKVKPAR